MKSRHYILSSAISTPHHESAARSCALTNFHLLRAIAVARQHAATGRQGPYLPEVPTAFQHVSWIPGWDHPRFLLSGIIPPVGKHSFANRAPAAWVLALWPALPLRHRPALIFPFFHVHLKSLLPGLA